MSPVGTVADACRVRGATPAQAERLVECGRAPSPAYARSLRAAVVPWRRPAEFIPFAHRDGEDVLVSRGLVHMVRHEVPGIRFVDQRSSAPHAFTFTRELRPEQRAAVDALVRCQQGAFVGPPGMGKSSVILGAVAAAGEAAAILVPSLPILAQFERDVRDLMGIRAAVIGEGREEVGALTLATFASLRDLERRSRLFARIGALFVDEAHGVTGDETRGIIDSCPARFRIAVTATWPTDERSAILHALFGSVVCRVAVPEMVGKGRLERPEYRQIRTAFKGTGNDFGALVDGTVNDEERNRLIVDHVAAWCGPLAFGLALVGRVAHAERLAAALQERGLRAESLTGAVKKSERERILTAARAGGLDVLCATSLADEGLDVPLISRIFLCAPQREGGRFFQRIGRAMRPHPTKPTPICFDFADVQTGLLAFQARKRREAFAALWREEAVAA